MNDTLEGGEVIDLPDGSQVGIDVPAVTDGDGDEPWDGGELAAGEEIRDENIGDGDRKHAPHEPRDELGGDPEFRFVKEENSERERGKKGADERAENSQERGAGEGEEK